MNIEEKEKKQRELKELEREIGDFWYEMENTQDPIKKNTLWSEATEKADRWVKLAQDLGILDDLS